MVRHLGEVAEWSNAAVSKTVEPLRVPGVRISPSPPCFLIIGLPDLVPNACRNSLYRLYGIRPQGGGILRGRVERNDGSGYFNWHDATLLPGRAIGGVAHHVRLRESHQGSGLPT
jgi:hypothetical protein